jgi:hypothetical protein
VDFVQRIVLREAVNRAEHDDERTGKKCAPQRTMVSAPALLILAPIELLTHVEIPEIERDISTVGKGLASRLCHRFVNT